MSDLHPADLTPEDLEEGPWFHIGRDTATIFARRERWMFRVVESISFSDRHSVKRRVSVDFEIPTKLPLYAKTEAGGANLLPVSVLRKFPPLMGFDLRNGEDLPMSLYTRATNRKLDYGLLTGMTDLILDERQTLSEKLVDAMKALILADEVSNDGVEYVVEALESELKEKARGCPDQQARIAATVDLAGQLGASALLWAPVFGNDRQDRIVKFSYVDVYDEPRAWWKQLLVGCSWWERTVWIAVPHAATQVPFHLIVESPAQGVELMHARTIALRSSGQSTLAPMGEPPIGPPPPEEPEEPLDPSIIADRLAHLYLGPRTKRSHRVLLVLRLAASRQEFIYGCVIAAFAIAALMSVVFAKLTTASKHADTMAVLLAAVPIVLGYVLVRPGDHAQERYHTFGVRAMVLASGGIPILGALTLALTPPTTSRSWWAALLIVSWALVGALVLSWLFAAPASERQRDVRWPGISQIGGGVAAVSVLTGTLLVCQPYAGRSGVTLTHYLCSHRGVVLAACALTASGLAAMYAFLSGVWRAIGVPSKRPRERTAATVLVVVAGLLTIWGGILSLALTAWQALTASELSNPMHVKKLMHVADVLANCTLAPMLCLAVSATAWLFWRDSTKARKSVVLATGVLAITLMEARVAGLLRSSALHPGPRSAWLGLAAWVGGVTLAMWIETPKWSEHAWLLPTLEEEAATEWSRPQRMR